PVAATAGRLQRPPDSEDAGLAGGEREADLEGQRGELLLLFPLLRHAGFLPARRQAVERVASGRARGAAEEPEQRRQLGCARRRRGQHRPDHEDVLDRPGDAGAEHLPALLAGVPALRETATCWALPPACSCSPCPWPPLRLA